MKCALPELEHLILKTSLAFLPQTATENIPLELLAKGAYFSVSFGLLRRELGECLAEPQLLLRYKGNWGGEGHGYVQTFTVSDLPEAISYVSDQKKLQNRARGREGGRENSTTFSAEVSASPKTL